MAEKKVSILISAKDSASKVLSSVRSGLQTLSDKAKSAYSTIGKGISGAASVVTKPASMLGAAIKTPLGMIAAIAAASTVGIVKSFTETASSFEALETSLVTVTGSLKGAKDAMTFVNQEAKASPFTVMEMAEAFKTLAAYGINAKEVMRTLVDTSAAMGKPLDMAVQALADAMQGEGERLKEFGIKQEVNGDQLVYTWVDAMGRVRETIAQNNPKIIQETLQGIWNEKYGGGAKRFANTWEGLTSTLKSQWQDFVNTIMQSGPFTTLKVFVAGLIEQIEKLKTGGQLGSIAQKFGDLISGGIVKVINFLPEMARLIVKAVEYVLLALSGWKQLIAGGGALFTQIQIWSLGFVNGLRSVMLSMAQMIDKIPGVDTGDTQRNLMVDMHDTEIAKENLNLKLEEQLTELGKIQIAQDEMREKWDKAAESAKSMMQAIVEPAAAAAEAAANVGESAAQGLNKASISADVYIEKLKEINRLEAMGVNRKSLTPMLDEENLRKMERTEG